MTEQKIHIITDDPYITAYQDGRRSGIADGRQSMAREIQAAIVALINPDDHPTVVYRLRLAADIAARAGGPSPDSERTGHA